MPIWGIDFFPFHALLNEDIQEYSADYDLIILILVS